MSSEEKMNGAEEQQSVHISNHPVLLHKVSILRNKETSPRDYRSVLRELTLNLGYEATQDLSLKTFEADGTLGPFEGKKLSDNVALVPIMRSGLGMVEPMLELLANAAVYHIGMYKNRKSVLPVQYFNRLPKQHACELAIVLDPNISTSGTIIATCSILKKWGAKRIKVITAVASKKGVEALQKRHPQVELYAAAVDKDVNEDGVTVPGIGDAGDRLFSTPYEVQVNPVVLQTRTAESPLKPVEPAVEPAKKKTKL
mmetsp:Transcript_16009/g.21158  ORF Transcript_16009/g.21158 Transcript_16009/m.21158 type:complete len:256 (+) Transcript_16009:137-904(+)